MKLYQIEPTNLQIGDYAYSIFTKAWYTVSELPNIINAETRYALIRKDGCGYYYLCKTLDELKTKISWDGGETYIFRRK